MKKEIEQIKKAIQLIADNLFPDGLDTSMSKKVYEILNPPNPDEFLECDSCRSKAGSPELCKGCIHNRGLIERLKH